MEHREPRRFVIQRYYVTSGWQDFSFDRRENFDSLEQAREMLIQRTIYSPNSKYYEVFEDGNLWRIVERVEDYHRPFDLRSYTKIFKNYYL